MNQKIPCRNYMKIFPRLMFILLMIAFLQPVVGYAQDVVPDGPVYVVQEGDTLWSISIKFGVDLNELTTYNQISNANQVGIGTRLVIPGFEGVQGELKTEVVGLGEDLLSLSRKYQVAENDLARLNHLTSPAELYVGRNLILPVKTDLQLPAKRISFPAGLSLLEYAVLEGQNPWRVADLNNLSGPTYALPGDVFHLPGGSPGGPAALPSEIEVLQLNPAPLIQGRAVVIHLKGPIGLTVSGSLLEHEFDFVSQGDGDYYAIQGVHAMTVPGLYPLVVQGSFSSGAEFNLSQRVYVRSGDYPLDPVLIVSAETVDPAVTRPEDAQWTNLAQPVTQHKQWQGVFAAPVSKEFAECWPSQFGNRRSYNGSPYNFFHTGLDFCGGVGAQIYAPAPGTVVFAGPLTVRGNATMIDHGWGIYSGYMHQSEINVTVGEEVETGQLIGLVGNTGRVTGPHLHFEIWAGGVQVDPMDWLLQEYP